MRADLMKHGWTPKQVSVFVPQSNYGPDVVLTVKDKDIDIAAVRDEFENYSGPIIVEVANESGTKS